MAKTGHTGQTSVAFLFAGFVSCRFWLQYGVFRSEGFLCIRRHLSLCLCYIRVTGCCGWLSASPISSAGCHTAG
ncbi:MAG: hypothetical protein E6Q75_14250 [Rheinheimera sp.]|nr:MAG: hypothetical protein E6Q75_14250 [Rheinheimera sp.]